MEWWKVKEGMIYQMTVYLTWDDWTRSGFTCLPVWSFKQDYTNFYIFFLTDAGGSNGFHFHSHKNGASNGVTNGVSNGVSAAAAAMMRAEMDVEEKHREASVKKR